MTNKLKFTDRQLKDFQLALYYERFLAHGAEGHNRLMTMAQVAHWLGIELSSDNTTLELSSDNITYPLVVGSEL